VESLSRPDEAASIADGHIASLPWQTDIAEAIRGAGVQTVAYVPDARLRGIVAALERGDGPRIRILTREEECLAYAAGHLAAGRRAMVLMQCSGLGNALNVLGSLCLPYGLGVPMIVSMRGTLGEGNPAQVPMGRATPALLAAMSVQTFELVDRSRAAATTAGALELAYRTGTGAAVILDAGLGGGREAD
jgi:sulfopyruvate decarboxylase subunit alpha